MRSTLEEEDPAAWQAQKSLWEQDIPAIAHDEGKTLDPCWFKISLRLAEKYLLSEPTCFFPAPKKAAIALAIMQLSAELNQKCRTDLLKRVPSSNKPRACPPRPPPCSFY